jgi:hypothetical protein
MVLNDAFISWHLAVTVSNNYLSAGNHQENIKYYQSRNQPEAKHLNRNVTPFVAVV